MITALRRLLGILLAAFYVGERVFDPIIQIHPSEQRNIRQLFLYPALVLLPRTRKGQVAGFALAAGIEAVEAGMNLLGTLDIDPIDGRI